MNDTEEDCWIWEDGNDRTYSIKDAYKIPMLDNKINSNSSLAMVWHREIPTKGSVLLWKVPQNKIASKDNLFRRCILNQNELSLKENCDTMHNGNFFQ